MNAYVPGQYTREEILSQPGIWESILQLEDRLDRARIPRPEEYDQVIFTGCGSTFFLSRCVARICESVYGIFSRAVPASDLILFPKAWLHTAKKTLLIAISRSAETTETVRALESFKSGNYGNAIVVTCYPDRSLAKLTSHIIAVPEAQEKSIAQTRSFSSMLLALISYIMGSLPTDFPTSLANAGSKILERYASLAKQLGREDTLTKFFFLGSGPLYGLANEAMLKMKEMSLSWSESYHALELRHGPMSLVDRRSLVVGLMSTPSQKYELDLFQEMRAKGAQILALTEQDNPRLSQAVNLSVVFESHLPETWQAVLYMPFLQLLAYERAMMKGLNPDQPNNLSAVVVLHD
jgi:glucosamine--fructose-6-phosphate aminotransferase (isomerizing)